MKTLNDKLSNEQAIKQLKQFAVVGVMLAAIGLFVFWWLGIAGLAFSVRALVLTNHRGNKTIKDTNKYRILAIFGILLGLADLVLFKLG